MSLRRLIAGDAGGGAPAGRNVGGGDFSTNFDEYATGFPEADADWTLQWSPVQQFTIVDTGGGDHELDKTDGAGTSWHLLQWEPPGTLTDLEVLASFVVEDGTTGPEIVLHISPDAGTTNQDGITCGLNTDNERIGTTVNGSFTSRATRSRPFDDGETWLIRARVLANVIGMKAWQEGGSEPETWLEYDATALGSPITDAGKMGVFIFGAQGFRCRTLDVWSDD